MTVGKAHTPPKRRRKGTPWSTWSEDQKRECASLMVQKGYKVVRNHYGIGTTPPGSTIRTWISTLRVQGNLRLPGRPRWLTVPEEERVYKAVLCLRRHGYVADRETLITMAASALQQTRGPQAEIPPLSIYWSASFRRRFKIGKLRSSTTDRPPLTEKTWDQVNAWRAELLQLQHSPVDFGVGLPEGWVGGIPDDFIIGVDETPLHYIPSQRGTYVTGGAEAVFIAGSVKAGCKGLYASVYLR